MERYTKIVATLGPAVASPEKIRALVLAGMDVARLNFSHGDHAYHRQFAEWVRQTAEDTGKQRGDPPGHPGPQAPGRVIQRRIDRS